MVFVPDCFKTQEMCNEAHSNWPWPPLIPDHLRTQETCNEIINPCQNGLSGSLNALKNKACVQDEKNCGSNR